jgi:predicted nucleic acid-binding protein
MPEIVISDTSTLIIFQKIDRLDILHSIYGDLSTTPEIAEEFGLPLPEWVKVKSVKDKKYQSFLVTQVDRGEASAIALASEYEDVLLILDDLKARKLAKKLNFKITGTLGIIHKAKQMSVIEKVKPVVDDIQKTNFRISDKIVKELLTLNDE